MSVRDRILRLETRAADIARPPADHEPPVVHRFDWEKFAKLYARIVFKGRPTPDDYCAKFRKFWCLDATGKRKDATP